MSLTSTATPGPQVSVPQILGHCHPPQVVFAFPSDLLLQQVYLAMANLLPYLSDSTLHSQLIGDYTTLSCALLKIALIFKISQYQSAALQLPASLCLG